MDTTVLVKWLNTELSKLLECEIGDEYSKNILNIETETEIKEFIESLLDLSISRNKIFLDELLEKLKKPSSVKEFKVYRKPDQEETFKSKKAKQPVKLDSELETKQEENKFESATNKSLRKACECQASKHKLISNCLNCGRIVCAEEGSGPCYFCGNLVCTREEMEKIKSGSNKGEKLKNKLLEKNWNAFDTISSDLKAKFGLNETSEELSLKQAIAHKDKLIDYDRTSAKRTQVIDDESDYFNTNSKWLTQQQRTLLEAKQEEVREKRFGSKLDKKFTIDFAGRKVIDEQENTNLNQYSNEIEEILKDKNFEQKKTVFNQSITNIAPKFIEEKSKKLAKSTTTTAASNEKENNYRIQDQGLQEMKDDGMCLSMHQPWASLLIAGIKKHEGRTWYTPHRGRLWIHAASKQPTESDIKETETFYRHYYSNKNLKFPNSYPTSCLLGFVNLEDCLSAETYKEKYPNGESDSEFVFICKNPREAFVKIPMSGQHKIFKLDKSIHITSKKTPVIFHDDDDEENNDEDY